MRNKPERLVRFLYELKQNVFVFRTTFTWFECTLPCLGLKKRRGVPFFVVALSVALSQYSDIYHLAQF